ncbi:MAG: zinc ribbon domain-containing protein [Candidatus Micrarchaeota archaeon]|nr:zinc ribbon domain-containing protein [Candidatus Micrarchaeota archaeon]
MEPDDIAKIIIFVGVLVVLAVFAKYLGEVLGDIGVYILVLAFVLALALLIYLAYKRGMKWPLFATKYAARRAFELWTSWPWWLALFVIWRLAHKQIVGAANLDIGGSEVMTAMLELLSLVFLGAVLVAATALALMLAGGISGGSEAGICYQCGALVSVADNYCPKCGSSVKR